MFAFCDILTFYLDNFYCFVSSCHAVPQESNNSPSVPDDAPERGRGAENEEPPQCKNRPGQSGGEAAMEGAVLTKLKQVVSQTLSHIPSLALDAPATADGILQRPYNGSSSSSTVAGERDPSAAEQNDTDSLSIYEDASAETPEHERLYLGQSESLDLPHDSAQDDGQHLKSSENCVVS